MLPGYTAERAVDEAPLAVVASIDGYAGRDDDALLVLSVQRIFNDEPIPERILVKQYKAALDGLGSYGDGGTIGNPDCTLLLTGSQGEEYLLIAAGDPGQPYRLSMSSPTVPLRRLDQASGADPYDVLAQDILHMPSRSPGTGVPLPAALQEWLDRQTATPWWFILPLAVLIPMQVLFGLPFGGWLRTRHRR